jgi:hypothetical protein
MVDGATPDPYAGYPVERRRAIVEAEILRLQDQRYRHELTISLCESLPEALRNATDLEELQVAELSIERLDVALRRLQAELAAWSGGIGSGAQLRPVELPEP